MSLCPKSLDVKLNKDIESLPQLFKNGVLQLSELFQHFIKAVGHAVSKLRREQNHFTAESGVIIEIDSRVCDLPECMEDDGIKKIHRCKMHLIIILFQLLLDCLIAFSASANTLFQQSA